MYDLHERIVLRPGAPFSFANVLERRSLAAAHASAAWVTMAAAKKVFDAKVPGASC